MLGLAVAAGRNDRLTALLEHEVVQAFRVVRAVGDDLSGGQAAPQPIAGRSHITLLPWSESKADRQAERDGGLGTNVSSG